jgi:cell wall-associated NlpC family hydrolase
VTAVIVPGLFATVALPAYAYSPGPDTTGVEASQALEQLKKADAQSVAVASTVAAPAVSRDGFTTTSSAEISRAALAVAYSAYTGPSAADFLANPPYPNFSLDQVVSVAYQYEGVPYRYGGADPSGFDCSGYVMFVYAQFGISLPHSASGIASMGTPIATSDAVPGDLVILPGHIGIYTGNGTFIDSGDYGTVVHVRPIYESDYYIVRIGI